MTTLEMNGWEHYTYLVDFDDPSLEDYFEAWCFRPNYESNDLPF